MMPLPGPKVVAERYVRRPFTVDAVQVTSANIEAVARWCGGDIRRGKPDHDIEQDLVGEKFIKVRVYRPMGDRQTMAFVGDWVLYAGKGYKVYTNPAFQRTFERWEGPKPEGPKTQPPAFTPGVPGDKSTSHVVPPPAVVAPEIGLDPEVPNA